MKRLARLSLRARLAIALVSVAVLTVAIATLFANVGLKPLVKEAAHARLQRSAEHMGEVAAAVFADQGGWTPQARQTMKHLAEIDGLRIAVSGGRTSFGSDLSGAATRSTVVSVGGRQVATIEVAQGGNALLTPEEQHLQHSLDRLHLVAGAVSVLAALVLAFLLAETLSRPMRRIRVAADRIGQGDLETRVEPAGDPELRAVAQALNRLAETLEQEEEIRKHTVADLAHELRTPVNGLLARIEAAQDGVLSGPDNLEAMHAEAVRLTRLLDDLSRLADAEQPGLLLDKQPLDLAEVAQASADSFAPRFDDAGIVLELETESVWVEGNSDRLEQVVSNLLSNALRYTPEGGAVNIRVERAGQEAVIEVRDTGAGIATEDQRHIYTRFWRGDPSRSPETGGTGIGLAIVRELVRAHDGRIDVESVVGAGSAFRVSLPAVNRPPGPASTSPLLEARGA